MADIRSDLKALKWMVGTTAALVVLVLGNVIALWAKLGQVSGQLAQIARALSH